MAMFWLIIAFGIDGVDGFLARMVKAKDVLPFIDGKNIDYVVDFVNYAFIPAYMFYKAELVPAAFLIPLTCFILLISALYYGRTNMVTDDKYFIGFPVLWNFVMYYYLFITDYAEVHYVWITLLIGILHFIPIKMAYPSQNERNKVITLIMTFLVAMMMLWSVFIFPTRPVWIQIGAYLFLGYFIALTVWDSLFKRT